MGIRRSCYCEMAVVLLSCKNTVKLLYVPAKYMCNVLTNREVFADFVSEAEAKGQRK